MAQLFASGALEASIENIRLELDHLIQIFLWSSFDVHWSHS